MKFTLPSMRVWMPDLAYQANISADRRRYLGRWADENMADTYTREHRGVISGIWSDVISWLGENTPSCSEVPENITSNHYHLRPPIPAATSGADNSVGQVGQVIFLPDEVHTVGGETPFTDAAADQGGPLWLIVNTRKTGAGSERKFKIHLLKGEGEAVGCGWRPGRHQYHDIAPHDVELNVQVLCRYCFKIFGLPFPVPAALAYEPSDAEIDSEDVVSQSSADTADEATGWQLATPFLPIAT
jgi:hypothetical protein